MYELSDLWSEAHRPIELPHEAIDPASRAVETQRESEVIEALDRRDPPLVDRVAARPPKTPAEDPNLTRRRAGPPGPPRVARCQRGCKLRPDPFF